MYVIWRKKKNHYICILYQSCVKCIMVYKKCLICKCGLNCVFIH